MASLSGRKESRPPTGDKPAVLRRLETQTAMLTRWTCAFLALAVLLPLECRQAAHEQDPAAFHDSVGAPKAPEVAAQAHEEDSAASDNAANSSSARAPLRPNSRTTQQLETQLIQLEGPVPARADWMMALRTDTPKIVPCQPLCVTIKLTNANDQARKLRALLGNSKIWMFVGRGSEPPRVVSQGGDVEQTKLVTANNETVVAASASVFFDLLLATERVDGSTYNNPAPKRIFSESGEYKVYAAVRYGLSGPGGFEVLRSEPLVVTVREPNEAEAPYVEFFRDGRQIPPHYGFSKVDEVAFDKVRGQGLRTAAFRRKLDAETIDKLREMLAKHPDPPVADDMRHYLMVKLIGSAKRYDEQGHDQGYDRDVLATAAQLYLDIAPERKQLRRRSIKRWHSLSSHFHLENAQPILQILASWKTSSPFYDDEAASQASLDEIIAKMEAPLVQQSRQRAATPPTD